MLPADPPGASVAGAFVVCSDVSSPGPHDGSQSSSSLQVSVIGQGPVDAS